MRCWGCAWFSAKRKAPLEGRAEPKETGQEPARRERSGAREGGENSAVMCPIYGRTCPGPRRSLTCQLCVICMIFEKYQRKHWVEFCADFQFGNLTVDCRENERNGMIFICSVPVKAAGYLRMCRYRRGRARRVDERSIRRFIRRISRRRTARSARPDRRVRLRS